MTEATTDAAETTTDEGQQQAASEYVPPASQADLNRIINAAVARTHKKYGMTPEEAAAAKAEIDQIKAANQTEAERLAGELTRWQTDAQTWRGVAVGSKIQALAAAEFADPSDAVTALGDKNYLDAGGQIDEAAITADLADVLNRKPHWRRPEGTPPARVPAPNPAQGSGGGTSAANPAAEFAAILQGQLNRS